MSTIRMYSTFIDSQHCSQFAGKLQLTNL